jgi:cupin fold WbuC family metalloprotein
MEIQLINEELLNALRSKAQSSDRLRMNFDLRTTSEDGSQRMLNCLESGTQVPIHRHEDTTETIICLKGRLDVVFYEELPNMDAGGPIHDGKTAVAASEYKEILRVPICPASGNYGIQIPLMAWHTVEVHAPSVIFEAKDGPYKG